MIKPIIFKTNNILKENINNLNNKKKDPFFWKINFFEKFWSFFLLINLLPYLNFFINNFLKFKNYSKFFLFRFLFETFLFKKLANSNIEYLPLFQKKNKLKKNKYIKKTYKLKKIGIYIRSFLKNKEIIYSTTKSCYLIMRFKRKNLFLTLLNNQGNVLCKTNIGSCGFKKKVKYTGYAIKRTSKRFSKKILGSFFKTIYIVRKNSEKQMEKIRNLIFLQQKLKNSEKQIKLIKNFSDNNIYPKNNKQLRVNNYWILKKSNYKNKKLKTKNVKNSLIYIKKLFLKKKRIKLSKKLSTSVKTFSYKFWLNKFINKQLLRKNLLKNIILTKFKNYRKYPHFNKALHKNFKINIRVKSNFKFWGFRFVMYGLAKRFRWFNGLEIRLPVPHSKGLRLKKKRRI